MGKENQPTEVKAGFGGNRRRAMGDTFGQMLMEDIWQESGFLVQNFSNCM